jgi:prepilin-type processing-associated H-X9-DG protein
VLRWFESPASCALPGGINPPATTCDQNTERRHEFSSAHPSGAYFLYADGHVSYFSDTTDTDVLKGLLTRDGGENVSSP